VIPVSPTVTSTYTISGVGANGCVNSVTITQGVNICLSVYEVNNLSESIKIFPNPSNGYFEISVDRDMDIEIINGLGEIVKQISIDKNNYFSVKDLPSGVYIVTGKMSNARVQQKVILTD
jgi:hypothetical protein